MFKRCSYLLIAIVVLAVVGIAGYLRPVPEPQLPVKVLFPTANAAATVFTHAAHAEQYNIDCTTCHHESPEDRPNPQPCGACHGVAFDETFIAGHIATFHGDLDSCFTCHHADFDEVNPVWTREMHDEHADFYAGDCITCHHDTDIEPEPESCANCHETMNNGRMPEQDAFMPVFRDAVHERCASCHDDWFADGLDGCANCHNMTPSRDKYLEMYTALAPGERPAKSLMDCAACHYGEGATAGELMLPRDQAFHTGCMSCHEEAGKGPYPMPPDQVVNKSDESRHCAQCHTG